MLLCTMRLRHKHKQENSISFLGRLIHRWAFKKFCGFINLFGKIHKSKSNSTWVSNTIKPVDQSCGETRTCNIDEEPLILYILDESPLKITCFYKEESQKSHTQCRATGLHEYLHTRKSKYIYDVPKVYQQFCWLATANGFHINKSHTAR